MRWRRLAFWSVTGFLFSLIAVLAWLWMADLGIFKPQIERWVSEKTGRRLSIGGQLSVDLAQHSVVVAEDVRFDNVSWAGESAMLEVGRVEVRVDTYSLIRGPVIIELIDIDNAVVRLARHGDGRANWSLPKDNEDRKSDVAVMLQRVDV